MRAPERNDWYAQGGWTNPGPVMSAPRSFGMWDGLFLWALLSNLNRPGATDFFHNHQSDPGYQQWRTEAESRAREDETLRRRLDELDRQLGAKRGQAVDVNYLPPGVPANVALAKPASARTPSVAEDESGGGGTWIWVAVILVAGVAIFIVLRWRGMRAGGQKDKDMGNLGTVGSMLRNKLSGEVYRPDRFRVGMTFAFDPTPFVLASGVTKIIPPTPDTGSRRLTVTSIGTVAGQGFELLRLYLPDERSVFSCTWMRPVIRMSAGSFPRST